MAQVCEICGKGKMFGKKVSHSHRHSAKSWAPNLRRVSTGLFYLLLNFFLNRLYHNHNGIPFYHDIAFLNRVVAQCKRAATVYFFIL